MPRPKSALSQDYEKRFKLSTYVSGMRNLQKVK